MPSSAQYDANSAAVNSQPVSVRSLQPHSASAAACARAEDHHPHVAGEVVDEQQEVASSSQCGRCHRATQVPVHKLEPFIGSKARPLGKGESPLLRQHADVAEFLNAGM